MSVKETQTLFLRVVRPWLLPTHAPLQSEQSYDHTAPLCSKWHFKVGRSFLRTNWSCFAELQHSFCVYLSSLHHIFIIIADGDWWFSCFFRLLCSIFSISSLLCFHRRGNTFLGWVESGWCCIQIRPQTLSCTVGWRRGYPLKAELKSTPADQTLCQLSGQSRHQTKLLPRCVVVLVELRLPRTNTASYYDSPNLLAMYSMWVGS